jgi:hypothetical protein
MPYHPLDWSARSLWNKITGQSFKDLGVLDRQFYTPPFSIRNGVVLDIGAYRGDTCNFFLRLGAAKVICIEPNFYEELERNIARKHMNAIVIREKFKLKHLFEFSYVFGKNDCEGYEEVMLEVDPATLKPMVVEVHGLQLADHFEDRGWTIAWRSVDGNDKSYANNYKALGLVA